MKCYPTNLASGAQLLWECRLNSFPAEGHGHAGFKTNIIFWMPAIYQLKYSDGRQPEKTSEDTDLLPWGDSYSTIKGVLR